jgi:hypothetical protein
MHPNGQVTAYEWAFGDVNPPVHAWAVWRVYKIERRFTGRADRAFLERIFHKLLLNFTWWVHRQDSDGHNVFQGGFLGLDNIGVFDRSAMLPTGGHLEQSDGTAWMGMYGLDMLAIASAPWQAIVTVLFFLGRATLFLLIFLFPDSHFVPRWSAVPVALAVALVALVTFLPSLPLTQWLTLPGGAFLFAGIGASAVMAQVYRYRRVSKREQRQQTKWVVFGIVLALAAQIGEFVALGMFHAGSPHVLALLLGNLLVALAFMLIPLSLAFAILRHRLWAIDLLINRALVYATLTAGVAGLYGLAVGTLSAVFRVQGNLAISLTATGLVAVLFQPARERLQRGVNRLLYGQRDEPYAVVSQLGRRLEAALTPDIMLSTVVETVAHALKLPYAALAVMEGPELGTLAAYGAPRGEPLVLPLIYQTEAVGELRLCPRVPSV